MSESASSAETPLPDPAGASDLAARAAASPFQLSQEPFTPQGASPSPVPGYTPTPAFEHLGELPSTYGTRSLYLVAYDPRQLFAYWDLDWSAEKNKSFALEVHTADGAVETRVELSAPEASRYIAVHQPGARYTVKLTARGRDGQWRPLAASGPVTMPPEGVAADSEPAFATLPFHLSFQRLIDLLKGARRPKEDLTDVLARLQTGGHAGTASLLGSLGSLGDEQLRTLEMLAQESFDLPETSGSGAPSGSGGLSSPGPSTFGRVGGGASETLSSSALGSEVRLAAAAAGAEALTSGAFGSKGRWLAEGLSSEELSSRGRHLGPLLSSGGMGSEALSSRGFGSESFAPSAARGSEAWRRAGGPAPGGSETLPSNQPSSTAFVRAVGSNLDVLGSLFSSVDSRLSGERGGSSSSSSSSR